MGTCCASRSSNDKVFDSFFNNMKIVTESALDVTELLLNNVSSQGLFYKNSFSLFQKSFIEEHIKGNQGGEWYTAVKSYLEEQFKVYTDEKSFNLVIAFILLSEGDADIYYKSILKVLRQYLKISDDENCINKEEFEEILINYLKFVSSDAVEFAKNLADDEQDFLNEFSVAFSGKNVKKLVGELVSSLKVIDGNVSVSEFFTNNFDKLKSSNVRARLVEISLE